MVKAGSALGPHILLIAIVVGISLTNEELSQSAPTQPMTRIIALAVAIVALLLLTYSAGLLLAAFRMFAKDTARVGQLLIQWGFFLTPIIWDYSSIPERFEWVLMSNPMVSLIEIYRYALLGNIQLELGAHIIAANLIVTLGLATTALYVHKKVQPQYAELL